MRVSKQKHNSSSKQAPQHSVVGKSATQPGKSPQQSQLVQRLSRVGNAANAGNHAALLNRAPGSQQPANKNLLLHLQRQYGNSYVNQVVTQARQNGGTSSQQLPVQTKLTIGPVGDRYEREADRTAAAVVQRINSPSAVQPVGSQAIQREKMPEEEVQKKPQITAIQREVMPGEDEQQAQMKPAVELVQTKKPEEEDKQKQAAKKTALTAPPQPKKMKEEDKKKLLRKKADSNHSKSKKEEEDEKLKHLQKKSDAIAEKGMKDEDEDKLPVQKKSHPDADSTKKPEEEDKLKHLQKKSDTQAEPGLKDEDEDKLPVQKKAHPDADPHKKPEEDEDKHLMQAKSDVGAGHGDKDEEDKMAQMQPLPLVQRRSGEGGTDATADVESAIKHARGKGRPLPDHVRSSMENAFGADFSSVKVHTDIDADHLNRFIQARAFTTGQDVFFRHGEFALGSKRGQELLAHELTHVVQQNGNAVQPKVKRTADPQSMPDSPSPRGMMDSQSSPDTGIQRLCSKCEKEHKQLKKEDETEGTIQAKGLSSPSSGVGIQSPVPIAQVDPSPSQQSAADFTGGRTVSEGIDSDRSLNGNASKLSSFSPGGSDRPPSTPQARTQAIENVLAVKEKEAELNDPGLAQSVEIASPSEPPPVVEVGSKPIGEETSPITKAVEAASIPQEKLSLPKEAIAEAEKEPNQGEALDKVPEVKALEEVLGDKQTDNLLPEGKSEAASPKTAAEKEQSTKDASEAQAQLDEKNAEAAQPASTGINFVLPKNAITIQGEGVPAFLRRRREIASKMADQFLATVTSRVQTVTQLGQEISAPIQTAAENAKASIMATVEQQMAATSAQIAQQRGQAQSAAQETQAEIQNQYQTAVTTISQTTADNRQQVETEHTNALQTLDGREKDQIAKVEDFYTRTDKQCRDTGVQVGDEAIAIGEEMARRWESQIKNKDDNFWDGPLTDNRLRAKAKAAREVAQPYKPGLIDSANKNADEVKKGKGKDIEGIQSIAKESRQSLETQKTNALDAFNASEQQALSQAQAAQANFTATANQSLQATLQSLEQEEATQSQLLTAYSQRQVLTIDRDAQKAIASLQNGVNQAATNLQEMLHSIEAEMQGKETPELNTFSNVLAELLDQADEAVATARTQTKQGITASEQGINEGGQKAIAGIAPIAHDGIEQAKATGEGLMTTLADLKQGATTTFNEIQQTHLTTITNTTNTALQGFKQVTQDVQTNFEQIAQNLDSVLQQSVKDLGKGLRDSFGEMRAKIEEEANKAADQVQPRWKGILKIALIVVVIVAVIAVTIVAAPVVIGAVGAAAGALGATAGVAAAIGSVVGGAIVGAVTGAVAGAAIQIGNNLIDGKKWSDDVLKSMAAGAISGALGGVGGALGSVFVAGKGLVQAAMRFGIGTASDVGGGYLGDYAVGNEITLEGVLIGAAIGVGVSIGVAGAVKVKGAVSGKADVPTGSRPNTELPAVKRPELEVKDTEIGAKSSQTRGRSTHFDKPELEHKPGVVASRKTVDGHEVNVLQDGRIARCSSPCQIIENWKIESTISKKILGLNLPKPRSKTLRELDKAVKDYRTSQHKNSADENLQKLDSIERKIREWQKTKGQKLSQRNEKVNQLIEAVKERKVKALLELRPDRFGLREPQSISVKDGKRFETMKSEILAKAIGNTERQELISYLKDYGRIYKLLGNPNRMIKALKPLERELRRLRQEGGGNLRRGDLGRAFASFERQHGFTVSREVPIDILPAEQFERILANGGLLKDIGAGLAHGEFSHRIQWHAVMSLAGQGRLHHTPLELARMLADRRFKDVQYVVFDHPGDVPKDYFRRPDTITTMMLTGRGLRNNAIPTIRELLGRRIDKRQRQVYEEFVRRQVYGKERSSENQVLSNLYAAKKTREGWLERDGLMIPPEGRIRHFRRRSVWF